MKTKIAFFSLVFLFLSLLIWAQPYEITEVDIFSLEKFLTSKSLTVYGISIENSIKEVLDKFGKTEADLEYKNKFYFLDIKSGLKIRSSDRKTIGSILLFKEFKENLKGKTAGFFDLTTAEEVKNYITECFGKPDYSEPIRLMGQEFDSFYYLNGFVFIRMFDRETLTLAIELTTTERVLSKLREK